MAKNPLQQLSEHGQSVWYDNLSRQLITSGGLQELIDTAGVVGVTSNPTIFDKAISGSSDYDDQIRALAEAGRTTDEIYEELVVRDIRTAADILKPVFEQSSHNSGDGFVSLEVSPTLAHDTQKTMTDARRLFARVDRPNVMIKIPGTPEGLPAIEQMLYEGVNINITLLFSLEAYRTVAEAYLRALERRVDEGKPIQRMASVASFFVSRVDTEADKRLDRIINDEPGTERAERAKQLKGTLAIANAKLAYQAFKDIFESDRFRRLAGMGARVQRPLWASTSTKNPDYSDTLYVDELIGPDTVQTLAPASIEAFGDHGTVADTLETDLDGARAVFRGFEELGISYDDITATLVREGVDSFAKSFESLLAGLDTKCERFRDEIIRERSDALGSLAPKVEQVLNQLRQENAAARLQTCDASLWDGDQQQEKAIANRLGWVPVVPAMHAEAGSGAFNDLATEVRGRGYRHVVLLGMGGSSLAPEVFAKVYGNASGFPELTVLDSTNPDTIRRVAGYAREHKTLFIVSTKSGTTVETMSLFHHFYEQHPHGEDFIAITDPGTKLEAEAKEKGFWRVFRNPEDIGGRYSALSYFGLVPAATIGVDVDELLATASNVLPVHDEFHPGVWLGAVLGAAQREGRDKLTLVAPANWEPFGDWLEQLIAESTGKQGTGILPVTGARVADPASYRDDRLFVVLIDSNTGPGDTAAIADKLQQAGQPVVRLHVSGPSSLGEEFVRWEVATAIAGKVLGINPFDEPNVQEAKDATNSVLKQRDDASAVETTAPGEVPEALLSRVESISFVAVLAYVDRTAEVEQAIAQLREAIAARTGAAVTVGYGPRYLHSTGQLHKGGPATGVFLQLVETPDEDLTIPGADFSFARLFAAQSVGDAMTLAKHGLPLARVEAGRDPVSVVRQITEAVNATAAAR